MPVPPPRPATVSTYYIGRSLPEDFQNSANFCDCKVHFCGRKFVFAGASVHSAAAAFPQSAELCQSDSRCSVQRQYQLAARQVLAFCSSKFAASSAAPKAICGVRARNLLFCSFEYLLLRRRKKRKKRERERKKERKNRGQFCRCRLALHLQNELQRMQSCKSKVVATRMFSAANSGL